MYGTDACYMHGGKRQTGQASPNYKHGKYSKYLPTRMVARYDAARKDPELTEVRHELALVDSRLADLLTRVDTGESGAMWATLKRVYGEFQRYRAMNDVRRLAGKMSEMELIIEQATTDAAAWHEIGEQIELRRKLCETETRRSLALQQYLSSERAMLMMGVILEIIARYVTDHKILELIAHELQRIGATPDPVSAMIEGEVVP